MVGEEHWIIKATKAAKTSLLEKPSNVEKKGTKQVDPKQHAKWIAPAAQSGIGSTYWIKRFVAQENADASAEPKPLKGLPSKLAGLVATILEQAPIEREGKQWAAGAKGWYCEQLGVSERQFQRIVKTASLLSRVKVVDGQRLVLLRPGLPSDRTPEDYARVMAREWKTRVSDGKDVQPKEFGLLVGLAKDWGLITAPDMFITALENWPAFMAGVKGAIASAQVGGDDYEADPDKFVTRYYAFPSISVMRRFWQIGVELYFMLPNDVTLGEPAKLY